MKKFVYAVCVAVVACLVLAPLASAAPMSSAFIRGTVLTADFDPFYDTCLIEIQGDESAPINVGFIPDSGGDCSTLAYGDCVSVAGKPYASPLLGVGSVYMLATGWTKEDAGHCAAP